MIGKYFRTKCGCIGKIVKTCNLFDIIASKEEKELVKDLPNIELGFIAEILTKEQITKWSYCGDLDRRSERGFPHES